MKIELKNIKYAAFQSEETHCFEATVYIDGKKSFMASNNGHGGCDSYYPLNGSDDYKSINDLVQKIDNELGKQELSFDGFKMKNCLEIVIGDLLNDYLKRKEVKKILKKIAYVKNGEVYTLPAKHKPTKENLESVKKCSWWKPEFIILNDLTIDTAMEYI